MTEAVQVALIVAAPATGAVVVSLIVQLRQAASNAKVAVGAVKEAAVTATKAAVTVETVHGLVNSQLAEMKADRDRYKSLSDRLLAILQQQGTKIDPKILNGG